MYREKLSVERTSIDSGSIEQSSTNNQETLSFTENEKDKFNDSISEMFKKMSIKDRESRRLSDLNNFDNNNSTKTKNDFMTSSPISKNSILKKPIFKTQLYTSKPFNESHETADKENVVPNKLFDGAKNNVFGNVINSDFREEPLIRAETVRYCNKPPIAFKAKGDDKSKNAETKKESNKSLIRSTSCCRSNASLNIVPKVTVPKPFSFENKDKALLMHRIKIVDDDLLEKKRIASSFRANPMPISSPRLPEKIVIKPTNPISFKFESEQRINYYQEKSSMKSFLETSSVSSSTNLSVNKTSDLSYLSKSPFKPKPSTKACTMPETPMFTLKSRLQQRQEFNEHVRQKELELEKDKEEREKERIEKEKMEYQQLRNQKIIKAGPIRHYKNLEIVHSNKVTVPATPKFSDRFKK